MMEGLYSLTFQGRHGHGLGAVVFMAGRVFGSDGGVQYDGVYEPNPTKAGHFDLTLKLTVQPGVELVQGVGAKPYEYNFDLKVTVPAKGGQQVVSTPFGPVAAQLNFLRGVPAELAA